MRRTRLAARADFPRALDVLAHLIDQGRNRLEALVSSQRFGVAGGAVAETEVLAHRDVGGLKAPDEHLVDELLGRLLGEALVERDHYELTDSEPGDQLGLHREAGQELRRRLGP